MGRPPIDWSIRPEVCFVFPRVYGAAVAFVLGDLGVAEGVVNVVAQRAAHDDVAVEFGEGRTQ